MESRGRDGAGLPLAPVPFSRLPSAEELTGLLDPARTALAEKRFRLPAVPDFHRPQGPREEDRPVPGARSGAASSSSSRSPRTSPKARPRIQFASGPGFLPFRASPSSRNGGPALRRPRRRRSERLRELLPRRGVVAVQESAPGSRRVDEERFRLVAGGGDLPRHSVRLGERLRVSGSFVPVVSRAT